MSNIVAKAHCVDDLIVPIPFDLTPSQIESSETQDIIVAVNVNDCRMSTLQKEVYNYYGKENCSKIIGRLPGLDEERTVYCVSISCILNKINSSKFGLGDIPNWKISPLWTEEKFGITPEEAVIALQLDEKICGEVSKKRVEYIQKLNDLKINMDNSVLNTIKDCRMLIQEAASCESKASKNCRQWAAKSISEFLNSNFPVNARVETLVEPVVVFCVDEQVPEEEAIVVGNAIDIVFNSIDPIDSERFFSEFLYDACSWPVVINETFEE